MRYLVPVTAALAVLASTGMLSIGAIQARSRPASAPTCIDADRIVSRRVVSADTIEFRLPRGAIYRSTLAQPCPHLPELDRTYIIAFENRNGRRTCGGDRFRLIDPVAVRAGGGAGFPYCRLGSLVRMPDLR